MAKQTVTIAGNLDIPLDMTTLALWDRFTPYLERTPDWQHYLEFQGGDFADSVAKRIRHLSLAQMLRHVMHRRLKGQIAECGVSRGHSAYVAAHVLREFSFSSGFYLFDSFKGFSEARPEDLAVLAGHVDVFNQQKGLKDGTKRFDYGMEPAQEALKDFEFIKFMPGWIPDRFHEVANESFAFVNIDLDLYEPTKKSLEFFYPRLVDGGVMHFDDYNTADWPGTNKAVNEYLNSNPPSLFYPLPLSGAFLIK